MDVNRVRPGGQHYRDVIAIGSRRRVGTRRSTKDVIAGQYEREPLCHYSVIPQVRNCYAVDLSAQIRRAVQRIFSAHSLKHSVTWWYASA